MSRKREVLIGTQSMIDESGTKYLVHTYQIEYESTGIDGEWEWNDSGYQVSKTSDGLLVNVDGAIYSLPQKNGRIIRPTSASNG